MTETLSRTRIPLLGREQVNSELATMYDALLKQRGVVPNMFRTLAHTPGLASGIAALLKPLLSDGALPGWYKELIATRMSVLCGSEYAVSAHGYSAKQKGATQAQIDAVKDNFEQGPFTAKEKLGLRCAEKIHRSGRDLDDSLFAELKGYYGDAEIIELIASAAVFEFFPRFVDGLRIPVTPLPEGK
jgi:AhpD family alkylhydroperoxidase